MVPSPRDASAFPLSLDLTISGDPRFVRITGALIVRFAEYVGYAKEQAEQIGGAIERSLTGAIEHVLSGGATGSMAITLATDETALEIAIRFAEATPLPTGSLERGLSAPGPNGTDLDAVRRVMDRVEFSHEGEVETCRLSCRLPPIP